MFSLLSISWRKEDAPITDLIIPRVVHLEMCQITTRKHTKIPSEILDGKKQMPAVHRFNCSAESSILRNMP